MILQYIIGACIHSSSDLFHALFLKSVKFWNQHFLENSYVSLTTMTYASGFHLALPNINTATNIQVHLLQDMNELNLTYISIANYGIAVS